MSGYRSSYVPWNKNSASYSSSSSSSAKKESPSIGGQSSSASTTTSKYESPYAKSSRTDAKKSEDKSPATSTKYSTYGSYQREPSSSSRAELTSRIRSPVEKKESHPPVTYRPLIRGSTVERSRSRDPSPDKTESPYNFNRLYPRPSSYTTRSVSRERTDSTSSSTTTIPKYTGRTSLTKEDYKYPTSRNSSREDLSLAKYKPPETKEDLLTARFGKPKEDYGKFKLKEDLLRYKPKEEAASRYKTKEETASRFKPKAATSREDLTKTTTTTPTQKYITSRFLPKNTIEKSHTAYIRPSTTRTREVSLKNRELLNVLSAQQDDRTSRPVSRASSIAPEDFPKIEPKKKTPDEVQEYETVTVISRSTSPNPPSAQTSYLRSRRVEMARLMEKQIKRPVKRKETSDKEVQSDRLDDSTKSSRFAGASRITPTPWASYLDLKYSPGDAKPKESESSQSEGSDKKSISRNSSAKSLSRSSSKSDLRTKELKSRSNSSHSLKSKASPPKKLPPQIPKPESKIPTNKDFRKSVLNMNPEGKLKKLTKRSNSCSSAESESSMCGGNSEATEVSENLSSCISYHPQKLQRSIEVEQRDRRSPSCTSESSSSSSSSVDDEVAVKKPISRTSTGDDSLKPPLSPRVKSESEAKSFLRRALAPVTNFFKTKQDSSDSTDKNISDLPKSSSEEPPTRRLISKIESGERAWWLEETDDNISSKGSKQRMKLLRHQESGERAWWLEDSAEVPEGVEVFPAKSMGEDGRTEDGKLIYKIRKNDSCEREWWLDESEKTEPTPPQQQQQQQQPPQEPEFLQKYKIRHIDSGERAWWLSSTENLAVGKEEENQSKKQQESNDWWLQNDDDYDPGIPLGDRASPEGLETPRDEPDEGRLSPYDNVPSIKRKQSLFISRHTNIDDILGGGSSQLLSPLMDRIFSYQVDDCEVIDANQVKIHDSTPQRGIIQPTRLDAIGGCYKKLDDAALQLYKDGDYGSYLDLDASISEQQEEFDGFHTNKKNSIVLRTQLSVRVHTIIEKLLTSEGRDLRRALFSLKQIFQEDKDLVHEFVQNDGLTCLIKVGSVADQNYQNYILRALGQVMLYVDGMNGVMDHNQTVQWLYTLISSKFRLVVKTALKLLLVFVEYTDSNCKLLIRAIQAVDCNQGLLPWHNIMKLLKDFDSADTELLIYATTLINKCLNGVPDQDTYYDQTDALEEQGIENIIKRYMSKPGTDLDLLQQFQIYEAVLQYEDGEDKGTPIRHLDESIRKTLMSRKSLIDSAERRKSRRHSTCTTPVHGNLNNNNVIKSTPLLSNNEEDDESSSSQSSNGLNQMNGSYRDSSKGNDVGVTPALRRRRERAERQRSFMKEQQENANLLRSNSTTNSDDINENGNYTNGLQQRLSNGNNVLNRNSSRKDLTPYLNAVNKLDSEENNGLSKQQPWIMYKDDQNNDQENDEDSENANENDRKMLIQLKKENTVKDLTQKLSNQNILLHSPSSEDNKINRIEGMTGLISKAKEGLAKSKSQANVVKSATGDNIPKVVEVKKSENELRWEELVSGMSRPLNLCDMDFTDLGSEDEADILAPVTVTNGIPPPPPPLDVGAAPPPPPRFAPPVPSPPVFGINLQKMSNKPTETKIPVKKNKKTVKLFWKEVRDEPMQTVKLKTGYIWDELNPVSVDTQKLEHLFESRAKDLINKKQQELNKNKEIIVLDPKRSNAINIGMTKLPPPRSIKTAILKMDATIMNREGIEKLLTMLPTEEERSKIQEAQAANPDLPLGSAEQFLLTLASISELPARLKLWAFKLDFENTEREIAEPLMDLKQGYEVLRINKTFRGILSTLLSIGNFLNGNEVKGFQIEYLSKVPEVKDTVHKHSLLHHLCHIVMEKFPDATDLYSEIGAITRASKVDFDELALNIQRLEADCKASWDHLKLIAKHDGSTMKSKMMDFLADCAERIILLGIIQRRVMNRFHKFLLWLGIPSHQISDSKPNEFCRIVSEFALEYRTTRERVLQQLEKKANHRERNKTRGKMITETAKFRTTEDRADAELRQLLGSDISDVESMQGTLTFRRTRKDGNRSLMGTMKGHLHDGDDEILDCLVKTATKAPTSRTAPRERKRTRHADRKSLKRSRTRENPFGHRDSP